MTQLALTPIKPVIPPRIDPDTFPVLKVEDLPTGIFWKVLSTALTLRRDYGSATESSYVAWLTRLLPVTMVDAAGNIHVDTRTDPSHRTMFTSHTDTVHSSGGGNTVRVDGNFWRASKGAALGADDGAGNAIMAHLIDRGVPGYYVFFRGEERGGIGSSWLAKELPELFDNIDRAVAFDRAGYYDVITHQSGGRCCSDAFAQALSDQLSGELNWYMPCSGGVYTDTAEFIRIIPECTNISVGYKCQHGDYEEQDIPFLWALAQKCVMVTWDTLPTERDPKAREPSVWGRGGAYFDDKWYEDYKYDYLKADGEYRGISARAGDNDLDDDDEDEHLSAEDKQELLEGSDEFLVMLAIEEAMDGHPADLYNMIAKSIYPEDPSIITKRLTPQRIDDEALQYAMDMLDSGYYADAVLIELYDLATPS